MCAEWKTVKKQYDGFTQCIWSIMIFHEDYAFLLLSMKIMHLSIFRHKQFQNNVRSCWLTSSGINMKSLLRLISMFCFYIFHLTRKFVIMIITVLSISQWYLVINQALVSPNITFLNYCSPQPVNTVSHRWCF